MDDDKWITDLISNVIVGVIKFALWAIRAAVKLIQFATIVIYHTTLDALSRKYPDARPGRLELIAGALAVMPTVARKKIERMRFMLAILTEAGVLETRTSGHRSIW